MLDGSSIVRELQAAREAGASRDALLREAVGAIGRADDRFDWVGIYLLEDETLALHSYIGRPTEHDRIAVGVGVCGAAVAEERDINVPNVNELENYLACSVETQSELVVLIRDRKTSRIFGQLDLDSDRIAAFTDRDEAELRVVADWLARLFSRSGEGGGRVG
ncbi:MAG: GAF domain-containing protein [Gemmatimonadota bacterium]